MSIIAALITAYLLGAVLDVLAATDHLTAATPPGRHRQPHLQLVPSTPPTARARGPPAIHQAVPRRLRGPR